MSHDKQVLKACSPFKKKMVNKKNRKAQFYIIAVVILIGIIASILSVTNYLKVHEKPKRFFSVAQNYNYEIGKVIDYSLYTKKNIEEKIDSFTENFIKYAIDIDPEFELFYVYGSSDSLIFFGFTEEDFLVEIILKNNKIKKEVIPGVKKIVVSRVTMNFGKSHVRKIIKERISEIVKMKIRKNYEEEISQVKLKNFVSPSYIFNFSKEIEFYALIKTRRFNETYLIHR